MSRVLTEQELHNMAMNWVGKQLEKDGFEFMAVNSKPKKNPQFVCLKNKNLHFIIVRHSLLPNNPNSYELDMVEKVKDHAIKFEAKTYYAGVGFASAKGLDHPLLLNEEYIVEYQGLIEIL